MNIENDNKKLNHINYAKCFSAWNEELKKSINETEKNGENKIPKPNLRNVLIQTFGWSLIPLGAICFFEECVIRLV